MVSRSSETRTKQKLTYHVFTLVKYASLIAPIIVLTYVVGFTQDAMIHETFHDLRHLLGFPSH